jgi:hypothetical protein
MVYTPLLSALRRLRQEDHEFEVSPSYIVRPCLKKTNKKTKIEQQNKKKPNKKHLYQFPSILEPE